MTNVTLYKYEVAPLLQEIRTDGQRDSPHYSKLLERSIGPINGALDITKAWVEVLESLTKQAGLRLLTALQMGNAVSPDDLMRKATAWCSSCYDEWGRKGEITYQPLLWMFSAVKICPRHERPLEQICQHCRREQIFFNSRTRSGYCSRCYVSLRYSNRNERLKFRTANCCDDYSQQIWQTEVVCKWIEVAQSLKSIPNKEEIIKKLLRLVDVYAGGNCAAFSRLCGLADTAIGDWLAGRSRIKLSSLLAVLAAFNIDLTEFLVHE